MEEERIDKILLERGLVSTRVRAEEIIKKYETELKYLRNINSHSKF